jgi:hypothetical protein
MIKKLIHLANLSLGLAGIFFENQTSSIRTYRCHSVSWNWSMS